MRGLNMGTPAGNTTQKYDINLWFDHIQVILLSVEMITQLIARHSYVLVADYYDEASKDKYWQHTETEVPRALRLILEHYLVFQRQLISRT